MLLNLPHPFVGPNTESHMTLTPTAFLLATALFGAGPQHSSIAPQASSSSLVATSELSPTLAFAPLAQDECKLDSCVGSNFNGTAIPAGRTIWFNSIVKVAGVPPQGCVLRFIRGELLFTANNQNFKLLTQPTKLVFSPAVTSATTVFDVPTQTWITTVPVDYTGNLFLNGLAYQVPANLPGGINPVTFCGVFISTAPGVTFQWKWAAAVYTDFAADENGVCVKPIDGNQDNPFPNSDHAGTPECWKQFVVGGGRGGGGSNFTGSYSGTANVSCP
jgi:hypothetical protein